MFRSIGPSSGAFLHFWNLSLLVIHTLPPHWPVFTFFGVMMYSWYDSSVMCQYKMGKNELSIYKTVVNGDNHVWFPGA
jgi:hypothetical protein